MVDNPIYREEIVDMPIERVVAKPVYKENVITR